MAALNTGSDIHHLDHIAPLALLKNVPLIVTEEQNALLAAKYYPEVTVQYLPDLEFHLQKLASDWGTLYECKSWRPETKLLLPNAELVFCPHGQSDKGYKAPVLGHYAYQDHVLLYGDLMKEMLDELGIQLKKHSFIGNFRHRYYEKHRDFLLKKAETEIFSHLEAKNRTLLYAPTWQDADQSTTFFSMITQLVLQLPSHWNLLVKLHPHLEQRSPGLYYRLQVLEEKRSNFLLVHEFPPVYPILEKIDAYLGDYSSVGYDVLAFEKPMFFLTKSDFPAARLHSCGTILNPSKNIFEQIDTNLDVDFHLIQRRLYKKAFTQKL